MQNWGKTKVQCLVRNTHSGIYYARARVNGKLLWKTLETDSLNFFLSPPRRAETPEGTPEAFVLPKTPAGR